MLTQLVQRPDFRAEVCFGFMLTPRGIEPVVVVADDVPHQADVVKQMYGFFDAIYGFKNVHVMTQEQFSAQGEEFRKANLAKNNETNN